MHRTIEYCSRCVAVEPVRFSKGFTVTADLCTVQHFSDSIETGRAALLYLSRTGSTTVGLTFAAFVLSVHQGKRDWDKLSHVLSSELQCVTDYSLAGCILG